VLPHDVLVDSVVVVSFSELVNHATVWPNVVAQSDAGDDVVIRSLQDVGGRTQMVIGPGETPSGLFSELDRIRVTIGPDISDMAGHLMTTQQTLEFNTGVLVGPGDTDDNGVVDERDVLPIGMHFNKTGPSRMISPNILWGQYAAHVVVQGSQWSSASAVQADADGSGRVEAVDVCAIACNWQFGGGGLTSAARASVGAERSGLSGSVVEAPTEALIVCPDCPGTAGPRSELSESV
jgi:hypothetical protein